MIEVTFHTFFDIISKNVLLLEISASVRKLQIYFQKSYIKVNKMNYLETLWLSLVIALSQSVSFRVAGKYLVTVVAPLGGTPSHLTFAQAWTAIDMVMANGVGTIQVGDVTLSVVAI
jgi:hypothetical protein